MSGNSDYVIRSNQHASRGLEQRKAAAILKLLSQCCNAAGSAQGTRRYSVCFIVIKKGCAGSFHKSLIDLSMYQGASRNPEPREAAAILKLLRSAAMQLARHKALGGILSVL